MINPKNITLSPEEMERCISFSNTSAKSQQAIEFGQKTTKARGVAEIARDNLIGKIAEVAFAKVMLANYGIEIPLDFNFYPRGQWDEEDTIINGWRIDIKGTRRGGKWMLIEWNKLNFRQRDNNLSHIFMMFTVDWDRDHDQPTGRVFYEGAASLSKLNNHCENTLVLRKGELLPGTKTHLQADNFGIRFRDLNPSLEDVIAYIQSQTPPAWLTESFRNPYTGQTTKEILGIGVSSETELQAHISQAEPEIVMEKKPAVSPQKPETLISEPSEKMSWLSRMLKQIKEWFS